MGAGDDITRLCLIAEGIGAVLRGSFAQPERMQLKNARRKRLRGPMVLNHHIGERQSLIAARLQAHDALKCLRRNRLTLEHTRALGFWRHIDHNHLPDPSGALAARTFCPEGNGIEGIG
jgi:hypothetical protein